MWLILIAASGLYVAWFYQLQSQAESLQAAAAAQMSASAGSYTQVVEVKGAKLPIVIAKDNPFRSTSVWAYVAPSSPLPSSYAAANLQNFTTLPHANEADVHLLPVAGKALVKLFTAAENAGYPLALSSAYRSIADQKALYDVYLSRYGKAYVDKYVAFPRTSEHHTGLAVDISDYTPACLASADNCSLTASAASWLARHAPIYGFILRYPDGKESVTGVAYEPWHFRFIGKSASSLAASGQTLDEFVAKVKKSS